MQKLLILLFAGFFLLFSSHAYCQDSPFSLEPEREIITLQTGLILASAGFYGRFSTRPAGLEEICRLNSEDVNSFDRWATENWSPSLARTSDFVLYGGLAINGALALQKGVWKDKWTLGVMYIETMLINYGLTDITKSVVHRYRPFMYNVEVPLSSKLENRGRLSFFSGHTSIAAASTFFGASVYSAYSNHSLSKKLVWAGAATIPAVVAVLRVQSGKHFPTDVLMGYLVGAGTGILIPRLHRTSNTSKQAHFMPMVGDGVGGLSFFCQF